MDCFHTVVMIRNIKHVVTSITVITARPGNGKGKLWIMRYICRYQKNEEEAHTISSSNHESVSETNGENEAEEHQDPVHLWNVYLAMDMARGVYDPHTWETSQSSALADDGE